MKDRLVDIVIVNWNGSELLKECINSILDNNDRMVNTIIVVDNHSTDDSLNILPDNPKLHLIRNCENRGFAKAANQGFKLCSAPFVLLLNPDTRLFSGTLAQCADFMNEHSEIAILGCQMLNEKNEVQHSCSRFPRVTGFFYDAIGLSRLSPKIFKPAILMTDFDHKTSRFVDQVMGAYMFMRRDIFKKTGYFDEQFFVYFEDVDFAKRVSDQAGKSYFNADIKIFHKGKGTTESVKAFRLAVSLHSRLLYGRKYFSKTGFFCLKQITFLIEPVTRFVFFLCKGDFQEVANIRKSYKLLRKRLKESAS